MAKSKKARGFITYKSYLFREKDPVIDAVRTSISAARKKYSIIQAESGVSATTIHNWIHGRTRRPQHATIAAVGRALGKKGIVWTANGVKFVD